MKPSPSELPLLKVLWSENELSARELHVSRAGIGKMSTLAALTRQFAKSVLEIDGPMPASSFGGSRILSAEELAELEALLEERQDK